MRKKILIAVANILEKNNKILLVQEAKRKAKGKWNFPAGRLVEKESLTDCLMRETKEETGLEIKPLYLVGIYQYHLTPGHNSIIFIFKSKIFGGKLATSNEILNIKWFSINEIKKLDKNDQLRGPYILKAIRDYKAKRKISLKFIRIL
jgi:8-oxo-dGTP pyrophosphatase MutT (NUDIX family)